MSVPCLGRLTRDGAMRLARILPVAFRVTRPVLQARHALMAPLLLAMTNVLHPSTGRTPVRGAGAGSVSSVSAPDLHRMLAGDCRGGDHAGPSGAGIGSGRGTGGAPAE